MALSDSINPDFITQLPVSKDGMRTQLLAIKTAIAGLENSLGNLNTGGGDTPVSLVSWQLLSRQTLSTATNEVRCNLPDGFTRYRIEFSGVRAVAADSTMQMRMSGDAGITYLTANSSYSGPVEEYNATGASHFAMNDTNGTLLRLSGGILRTSPGAFGTVEFTAERNMFDLLCNYITATSVRNARRGWASGNIAKTTQVQFFVDDFAANFAAGSSFAVLARP